MQVRQKFFGFFGVFTDETRKLSPKNNTRGSISGSDQ